MSFYRSLSVIILQVNTAKITAKPSSLTYASGDFVRWRRGYKIRVLAAEQQLGSDCWLTCHLSWPRLGNNFILVPFSDNGKTGGLERLYWKISCTKMLYTWDIRLKPAKTGQKASMLQNIVTMLTNILNHLGGVQQLFEQVIDTFHLK